MANMHWLPHHSLLGAIFPLFASPLLPTIVLSCPYSYLPWPLPLMALADCRKSSYRHGTAFAQIPTEERQDKKKHQETQAILEKLLNNRETSHKCCPMVFSWAETDRVTLEEEEPPDQNLWTPMPPWKHAGLLFTIRHGACNSHAKTIPTAFMPCDFPKEVVSPFLDCGAVKRAHDDWFCETAHLLETLKCRKIQCHSFKSDDSADEQVTFGLPPKCPKRNPKSTFLTRKMA